MMINRAFKRNYFISLKRSSNTSVNRSNLFEIKGVTAPSKQSHKAVSMKHSFERSKIKGKINKEINSGMVLNDNQLKDLNNRYYDKGTDKEKWNKSSKAKRRLNILTTPHPNLISSEKTASRYQDYYITPKELITRKLSHEELKIVNQDPTYFGFSRLSLKIQKDDCRKRLNEILNEEEQWESKRIRKNVEPVTRKIFQRLSLYNIKGLDTSCLLNPHANNSKKQLIISPLANGNSHKTRNSYASLVKSCNNSQTNHNSRNSHHESQCKNYHIKFNGSHCCKHQEKIDIMNDRISRMNYYHGEYVKENRRQFNTKLNHMHTKVHKRNAETQFLLSTLSKLKSNYTSASKGN